MIDAEFSGCAPHHGRPRARHAELGRRSTRPAGRTHESSSYVAADDFDCAANPLGEALIDALSRFPGDSTWPEWPAPDAARVNRPGGKVAILGGGMAGLSAAWRLSEPGWRDRFESITVYQRGWRLGGKGASSRGEQRTHRGARAAHLAGFLRERLRPATRVLCRTRQGDNRSGCSDPAVGPGDDSRGQPRAGGPIWQ